MMKTESIDALLGRLYTSFLLRDLAFVLSGGFVTALVLPSPVTSFARALSSDSELRWLGIPAFLGTSYVIGFLLQEAGLLLLHHLPRLLKKAPKSTSKLAAADEPLVVSMEKVKRVSSAFTVDGVERILVLKQYSATVFSASLTLALLHALGKVPAMHRSFPWAELSVAALCAFSYSWKARQQQEILAGLIALPHPKDD